MTEKTINTMDDVEQLVDAEREAIADESLRRLSSSNNLVNEAMQSEGIPELMADLDVDQQANVHDEINKIAEGYQPLLDYILQAMGDEEAKANLVKYAKKRYSNL